MSINAGVDFPASVLEVDADTRVGGGTTVESQHYHKSANTLSPETRTFALMIVSLTEEAEVVNWYEQRISAESNPDARARMLKAQNQGFKNFCLDLEFLLRQKPHWRALLQDTLFSEGKTSNPGENVAGDEAPHY